VPDPDYSERIPGRVKVEARRNGSFTTVKEAHGSLLSMKEEPEVTGTKMVSASNVPQIDPHRR
jgi:hypothetical protein